MPGLYRIQEGWREGEDSAVLGSDRHAFKVEISEKDYRSLGYRPEFDALEWEDRATVMRASRKDSP